MRVPQAGEQFGRYRLDRIIGQGGMGVVYAATDTRLQRTVALKVITGPLAGNEQFLRRFHDEASVLAQLDSPYVIQITDHDEIDDIPYIVTQFVDGTDLASYLTEHGPLPARAALTLAAQVARGLGDAHRRGVIHRDIKPGNVLVRAINTPDMHAYVCDFGIARSDTSGELTATGMVAGTWTYLAPERTQGAPASASSDLYALGCLLWASLTGNPPYGGTDVELVLAHAQQPIPRLPGADPFTAQLNGIIGRLMAKDPKDRYPDAASARADLEALAAIAPTDVVAAPTGSSDPTAVRPAAPTGPRHGAAPAEKKRKWPLVAAGAAVLLLIGGGATIAAVALGDDDGSKDKDAEQTAETVGGDVNGDGYGDVVVHQESEEYGGSPLSLWTLPSSGKIIESPVRAPAEAGRPLLGDVDGDGIPEVVWVDDPDDVFTAKVVPAEGAAWTPELTAPSGVEFSTAAMLGDVDGDGKADLIVPGGEESWSPATLYVALSEGDAFGELTSWWNLRLSATEQDALVGIYFFSGDFDGDGRTDVINVVDSSDEDAITLLTSDGTSFATGEPGPLPSVLYNPLVAEWEIGDIDGDGADELVVVRAGRQSIDAFEPSADVGLGEPTPWREWGIEGERARKKVHDDGTLSWTLSDVDGDGDADLVTLREPIDGELGIRVRVSDGSAFGGPEPWGMFPCGTECADRFNFTY